MYTQHTNFGISVLLFQQILRTLFIYLSQNYEITEKYTGHKMPYIFTHNFCSKYILFC
jgi:hypothetical protein